MTISPWPCGWNVCCGTCVPGDVVSIVRTVTCPGGAYWGYIPLGGYRMGTVTAVSLMRGGTAYPMAVRNTPTDCLVVGGACSAEMLATPYASASMVGPSVVPGYDSVQITSVKDGETYVLSYPIDSLGVPPPYVKYGKFCIQDNYAQISEREIWGRTTVSGGVCPAPPAEAAGYAVGSFSDYSIRGIASTMQKYLIKPVPPADCTGLTAPCYPFEYSWSGSGAHNVPALIPRYWTSRDISSSMSITGTVKGATITANITITKPKCAGCGGASYCWEADVEAAAPCEDYPEGSPDEADDYEWVYGDAVSFPCSGIIVSPVMRVRYNRKVGRLDSCRVLTTGAFDATVYLRWEKAS